jgi:hypothetical protein
MDIKEPNSSNLPYYRFRNELIAISAICWVISLALPTLIPSGENEAGLGIGILLMGWLGFAGIEDGINLLGVLAWWANPFYLFALASINSKDKPPIISTCLALGFASLTSLLSSYAINTVPSFTTIVGYGPGVLLWFFAILTLAYVVAKDTNHKLIQRLIISLLVALFAIYAAQIIWRSVAANESERGRLPFYAAKRGIICSVEATKLPIPKQQLSLSLESSFDKEWLDTLRNWGITAIQIGKTEYKKAEAGSPESRKHPYMTEEAIYQRDRFSRYTLRIEGGYPYINKWSDGRSDFVRLTIIENKTEKEIGHLMHYRELNSRMGFCPSLPQYSHKHNEEAIKWLAPFISADIETVK